MSEGSILSPSEFGCSASLVILCKHIADYCEKTYPGWLWAIEPNEEGGVIYLRALRLHGKYGIVMRIADVQDDPQLTFVRKHAGEVLERFGVPRSGYKYEYTRHLQKDISGDYVFDMSDKTSRKQQSQRDNAIKDAVKNGLAKFHRREVNGQAHVVLEHHGGGLVDE